MSTLRRGNIWWYEFQFQGQRIRESSHSKSKAICERAERGRRSELELGANRLEPLVKPKLFSAATKEYLLEREPHWSPKTREMHANSLQHLGPHFTKKLLNEINDKHISRYQRTRLKEGASNRTINIEIALVRLILRDAGLWKNIADKVKMLKEQEEIGRSLSDYEVHRLQRVGGSNPSAPTREIEDLYSRHLPRNFRDSAERIKVRLLPVIALGMEPFGRQPIPHIQRIRFRRSS